MTEWEDLLSLDDDVVDSVFQYSSMNIRRVPTHVVVRLKDELGDLLVQRSGGRYCWYHRQLIEAALDVYSGLRLQAHQQMGTYFANLIPADVLSARLVAAQPRLIGQDESSSSCWNMGAKINESRAEEGGYHLVEVVKMLDRAQEADVAKMDNAVSLAVTEICSLDSVIAAFRSSSEIGMALVSHLSYLSLRRRDTVLDTLYSYYRWILLDASKIANASAQQKLAIIFDSAHRQPKTSSLYTRIRKVREELFMSSKISFSDICLETNRVFCEVTYYTRVKIRTDRLV